MSASASENSAHRPRGLFPDRMLKAAAALAACAASATAGANTSNG